MFTTWINGDCNIFNTETICSQLYMPMCIFQRHKRGWSIRRKGREREMYYWHQYEKEAEIRGQNWKNQKHQSPSQLSSSCQPPWAECSSASPAISPHPHHCPAHILQKINETAPSITKHPTRQKDPFQEAEERDRRVRGRKHLLRLLDPLVVHIAHESLVQETSRCVQTHG